MKREREKKWRNIRSERRAVKSESKRGVQIN